MTIPMWCQDCEKQREFLYVTRTCCVCPECGHETKTTKAIAILADWNALAEVAKTPTAIRNLGYKYGVNTKSVKRYIGRK